MKKIFLLLVCYFFFSTYAMSQAPIDFTGGWSDPTPVGGSPVKHPVNPPASPAVYLDNYTLTFTANHPEYVLYIKDESEAVVYSTVVSSVQTTVVLPSYLSGS